MSSTPSSSALPATRVWPHALRLGCAVLALSPVGLLASGTRVGFKDPFATARGDAFAATADDPAAIYYNPAGLTQLSGQQASASVFAIQLSADYRSAVTGATTSMNRETRLLPQFYYSWTAPSHAWALGLGYYVPFGLATDWPATSGFRTFATKNQETLETLTPVAAWRINDQWSIGGGLTFNRLTVDLRRGIGILPTDEFRFNAHGSDTSFNVGVRWQPDAQDAFGLTYRRQTSFNLSGTATSAPFLPPEAATAQLPFPEVIVGGYSYRPNPQWNLEADLDWTNWTRVNTLVVNQASGPIALPLNWRSGFFYELGATRYLAGGWLVSLGYTYPENSVPETSWNPAIPDANHQFFSGGFGYDRGPLRFMVALQHAHAPTRTIRGTTNPLTGASADGAYNVSINSCSASLDYHF
jgi:long-chain fatty acid transport protein